jgi:hypothetical protein
MNTKFTSCLFLLLLVFSCSKSGSGSGQQGESSSTNEVYADIKSQALNYSLNLSELDQMLNENLISQSEYEELKKLTE